MKLFLLIALCSFPVARAQDAPVPASAPAAIGPVDVVKKIFDLAGRPEVATDAAKQAEVNALVDYDALARAALGAQFKVQPAAEFAWFRDTLKDIIGRTVYPKAPDFLSGVKISYKTSQSPSGKSAQVQSNVQNKADLTDVDYKLTAEKDASWKVSDVAISGQSWVDSIREQVASVIKKKKWKGLKENMNRRLNELKAGKA
jgi:ABC-type transporter MlaC component